MCFSYILCTFDAQRTKRILLQFADNAGPDQGLRCMLTELMDTVVYEYVDKQRMLISNCTDAHAVLHLRCPEIA